MAQLSSTSPKIWFKRTINFKWRWCILHQIETTSECMHACVRACACPCSHHCLAVQYRGGGRSAGDGATCSRCGRRRRCPGLISLARGAAAWLPSSTPGEYLFHQVCVCGSLTAKNMEGAWTGIIMCCCDFLKLEYELCMTDKHSVHLRPSLRAFLEHGLSRLPSRPEWPSWEWNVP